jgi:hypothetical protein
MAADLKDLHSALAQTLAPDPVSITFHLEAQLHITNIIPHTLNTFSSLFNPSQALIKQAEAFLKAAQAKPGFGISILQVCFTM